MKKPAAKKPPVPKVGGNNGGHNNNNKNNHNSNHNSSHNNNHNSRHSNKTQELLSRQKKKLTIYILKKSSKKPYKNMIIVSHLTKSILSHTVTRLHVLLSLRTTIKPCVS